MKIKNFFGLLLACGTATFLCSNIAITDETAEEVESSKKAEPKGEDELSKTMPHFIYLCFLDTQSSSRGTVVCYKDGTRDYSYKNSAIDFEGKVKKMYMACVDQTTAELREAKVWIAVNYENGSSELFESTSSGSSWSKKKTYGKDIGGISLSTDGTTGWVAVNDSPHSRIDRWQLTDPGAEPIPIETKLEGITNLVANMIKGQNMAESEQRIWCICEGNKKNPIHEKRGDGDFRSLENMPEGDWSMRDDGVTCCFRYLSQKLASFIGEDKISRQPHVEWFPSEGQKVTDWSFKAPRAIARTGITLDHKTITYLYEDGRICVLTIDPKDPNKILNTKLFEEKFMPQMVCSITATREQKK